MLSDMQLHQNDISRITKDLMPTWWSLSILLFLVSFVIITRVLTLVYQEEAVIPAFSSNVISYDNGLSQTELETLVQLSSVFRCRESNEKTNDNDRILYDTFEAYLKGNVIAISSTKAKQAFEMIDNLKEIVKLEGDNEYENMSLEGRNVFLNITKEFYQLYDLDLIINVNGDVHSITDSAGHILYFQDTVSNITIAQVKAILIITLTAFILLLLCILFARKNHLFKKEVNYDGIDKERYA